MAGTARARRWIRAEQLVDSPTHGRELVVQDAPVLFRWLALVKNGSPDAS